MKIYRCKYLLFILVNYIVTFVVFLKYKTSTQPPPPFAHHLVAQMYMCFFIIQEQEGKSAVKTFWLWSLLLMMAHLLGVATTIFFNFENVEFITEYLIKYCVGDLLLIIVSFIFVIIFSTKIKKQGNASD